MADGVDRLDAVRRGEVPAEELHRRRPVGRVGRRVGARLDEAAGERGEVPGDREREREDGDAAAAASAAGRASGSRSGSPRSAAARCSRRGSTGRGTRRCRRRGRRRTSTAARPPCATRQVSRMPRPQNTQAAANSGSENGNRPPPGTGAAARARRRSRAASVASGSASSARRGVRESPIPARITREQHERHRARREHEHREEREPAAPSRLQRPEREQRERDAEREREGAREHDARPDDGERAVRPARSGAPLAGGDDPERERGRGDARDGEQLDPEQGRERVVEEAVGDEAVAPGVPEVVPDPEPVILEQGALVQVRREVAARRAEPGESGGERSRRRPRPQGPRGGSRVRSGRSGSCSGRAGAPVGS